MNNEHGALMDICLELARRGQAEGNIPVGSVIARGAEVLGTGRNRVMTDGSPLKHAEIVAIEAACRATGSVDLSAATLYTSLEPCPMCCWAIHVAGIRRLVLGGRHATAGSTHVGDYSVEKLLALTRQDMELIIGVRQNECEHLIRSWRQTAGQGR
jgi:tRNA(Arg) A34 adenosine deaminase TadA